MQAIISDIHSNIEAFEAVLADIKSQEISDIVCLGDLIGYGPNPIECIKLAIQNNITCIYGNHEAALFQKETRFNPRAQQALNWTKRVLQKSMAEPGIRDFLKNLTYEIRTDKLVYAHGSPRDNTTEYLIRSDDFFQLKPEVKETLKQNFALIDQVGFTGHTHIPCVCTDKFYLVHPSWQDYQPYPILWGTKTLINAGSVGQPRDNDNRACYVIFDGKKDITHRRVEYAVAGNPPPSSPTTGS
jgi:predicted phosphodiesterase